MTLPLSVIIQALYCEKASSEGLFVSAFNDPPQRLTRALSGSDDTDLRPKYGLATGAEFYMPKFANSTI